MKKVIFYSFLIYGIFALIFLLNESRMKSTNLYSIFSIIIPRNYKMFVDFPTRKGEIIYYFYNNNDTISINGTRFFQQKLSNDFPFISTSFYPLSSMDYDFRRFDNSFAKNHWKFIFKDKFTNTKADLLSIELNNEIYKDLIKTYQGYAFTIREYENISLESYPKMGLVVYTQAIKPMTKIKQSYYQFMGDKKVLSYYE